MTTGIEGASVARPFADLFSEAERQLNVCNSCRYCEGYCAVFPALERRRELSEGDIIQLANLCHDCRACLYACMYAPPHEFAINPPRVLSEVRGLSLRTGTAAAGVRRGPARTGRSAAAVAFGVTGAVLVILAGTTEGLGRLWSGSGAAKSPYGVISYPALLAVMAATFAAAVVASTIAGWRYWRSTHGRIGDLFDLRAWRGAVIEAGELRYLKGGGADCQYPTEVHSPVRRYLHGAVAYGFGLCLVSTTAAAVSQDIAGAEPPYRWLSVPVIAGVLGGAGLVIGSVALAVIKPRSDPEATDAEMTVRDYNLLAVLALLGATGLASLLTRTTAAYGVVLTVHLAVVATAFVLAPFTKFNHVLFRLLALVQDNIERSS